MKKKIYKSIVYLSCVIFVCMFFVNTFISCDIHVLECNREECSKCFFIHNTQEILKNIFVITCITILLINVKIIDKIIIFCINILYTNLVLMKVRLNE